MWADHSIHHGPSPQGSALIGAVVVVHGQPDLLEVVGALGPPGRLAGRLHRREQQRDQHGDDGDDDQQLDQREAATARVTMIAPPTGERRGRDGSASRPDAANEIRTTDDYVNG